MCGGEGDGGKRLEAQGELRRGSGSTQRWWRGAQAGGLGMLLGGVGKGTVNGHGAEGGCWDRPGLAAAGRGLSAGLRRQLVTRGGQPCGSRAESTPALCCPWPMLVSSRGGRTVGRPPRASANLGGLLGVCPPTSNKVGGAQDQTPDSCGESRVRPAPQPSPEGALSPTSSA